MRGWATVFSLLLVGGVARVSAQEQEQGEVGETRGAEAESAEESDRRRRRSPTTTAREATPLFLRSPSGHQSIELGVFLSTTLVVYPVEAPAGANSGFQLDNARLAFWGDLFEGFEYVFQLEFARIDQPLLDLAIAWEPLDEFRLTAGLFKTPFSKEFLLSAANIPLQQRAQVVRALAPNRQAGFQVSGRVADGAFTYAAGIFNGNTVDQPDALSNVDEDFLYVARVGSELQLNDELRLELGANVAGGREDDLRYAFVGPDPFAGGRLLVGADARLTWRGLLLSTEWNAGLIDPDDGALGSGWVWGFHGTVGYSFLDYLSAYVRWDHFDTSAVAGGEPSDRLVISLASGTRGAAPVGAQIDYVIPVRDTDGMQLLVNVLAVF